VWGRLRALGFGVTAHQDPVIYKYKYRKFGTQNAREVDHAQCDGRVGSRAKHGATTKLIPRQARNHEAKSYIVHGAAQGSESQMKC